MGAEVTIEPAPGARYERWRGLAERAPGGDLLGRTQQRWREATRTELGLPVDRLIIATGHQALLWHPGILAKYLAMEAAAAAGGFATANLVVDQHAGGFGGFDVPVRSRDGSLAVRRIELTHERPDVPMAQHPAFSPPRPPALPYAIESVGQGVGSIIGAIGAHRDQPNAALQMARALGELMQRWVGPAPDVPASALLDTTLGRALLDRFAEDPRHAAECYNRAVAAVPEAGIGPLLVREDSVEAPLWRLRPDGRRMRGDDRDTQRYLNESEPRGLVLLPRALLMTALVRLGMCDLFIHGTGGANYDRAMELWVRDWLSVDVAPKVSVTATLRLPLEAPHIAPADVKAAQHVARRAWHDPENAQGTRQQVNRSTDRQGDGSTGQPGPAKREMLRVIGRLPRNSPRRREAFRAMHERLDALRHEEAEAVQARQRDAAVAQRHLADAAIAARRDWAFPLSPREMIDELAQALR